MAPATATATATTPLTFPSYASFSGRHHSLPFQFRAPCGVLFSTPARSSSSSFPRPVNSRLTTTSKTPLDRSRNSTLEHDIRGEISRLKSLRSRLQKARNLQERMRVLDGDSRVKKVFGKGNGVLDWLDLEEVVLVKCLVAAGQGHVVGWEEGEGNGVEDGDGREKSGLKSAFHVLAGMVEKWGLSGDEVVECGAGKDGEVTRLLKTLDEVEKFYDCIGGIIGYQITVLDLLLSSIMEKHSLSHQLSESMKHQYAYFHAPTGLNLLEDKEYASQAALWGIEGLPKLGEIYPLGGAGDRLGLIDHITGDCLPAAMLPYCGRTLLEGLIRDLQAREFLYYKIYKKQCITPVAIMTSAAKDNHEHISALCERLQWFGRGRLNFQLFEQPLVPVVAVEDGQWVISKQFILVSKPGGHGAIWKLAHDKGIFKWFYSHGRIGATVRQVSNVVAATDVTLLALAGVGLHHKKKLGFASCQRISGATEGINVLVEKQNIHGEWEYGIACIEYTEFENFGIKSAPVSTDSLQSDFPANTNILYVDLPSVEKIGSCKNMTCLPGMVLNLKKPVPYVDHFGTHHSVSGGRLECTMQSIADNFLNTYHTRCFKINEATLDTFIVYNERKRVTSSAKRKRKQKEKSLHQTPDGALLDMLRNAADILSDSKISIPKMGDNSKYFNSRPPFLILLHPALGPIWEVTRQKFHGGSISEGSELQLEVAEFLWKNVELDGSLIVFAENVMGSTRTCEGGDPILHYGYRCGRCRLSNVKVLNKGIDWNSMDNVYWKHSVQRLETLRIVLQGNAEFEAKDVILQGNHVFEVPNGFRMTIKACSSSSGFSTKLEPIKEEKMDEGSWFWRYKLEGTHVNLKMIET